MAVLTALIVIEDVLEYDLAIALNNLCYFDGEEATDDVSSQGTIKRLEAQLGSHKKAADGKAD